MLFPVTPLRTPRRVGEHKRSLYSTENPYQEQSYHGLSFQVHQLIGKNKQTYISFLALLLVLFGLNSRLNAAKQQVKPLECEEQDHIYHH